MVISANVQDNVCAKISFDKVRYTCILCNVSCLNHCLWCHVVKSQVISLLEDAETGFYVGFDLHIKFNIKFANY